MLIKLGNRGNSVKHLKIILICLVFCQLCSALNYTALSLCQDIFFNCSTAYNLNYTNNNSTVCFNPYIQCVNEHAFSSLNRPLECHLAESGWENLDYTCYFSTGIFIASNIVWPGLLKYIAHKITNCAKADKNEHYCEHTTGQCLLQCTDTDRDKNVTAPELSAPQAFITLASVGLPIIPLINANDAQARCNYALQVLLTSLKSSLCK